MLQNLTNFFNLIRTRKIKTTLADNDLIAVGTRDTTWGGNYQPTAITALGATGLLQAQYWTSTAAGATTAMISSQATLVIGPLAKNNPQPGRPFRKF